MANPQKENGFTAISNELIDAFQRLHLSGNQWKLLWTILRLTYGWNKKTDYISLTTFEKCTGLNRWNFKQYLDDLFHREIIIRDNSGYITKYGLQKDYTKWKTSIKNNTSIKNDTATGIKNNTKTSIKNDTHKRQKTIKDMFDPNSFEIRMAQKLFSFIQERNPGQKKPNIQKWAMHIDRMIRVDGRKVDEIERLIKWSQEDEFWKNNILSTASLRKKYDTLWLKAGLNGKKKVRFDEIGFTVCHREETH